MKRAFDVLAASSGLVLCLPLGLVIAALVRLTSPGPAIFKQVRVGRDRRPFACYKFRTMRAGTGDYPTHESPSGAVTPIGHMLRRAKLDELPQLWNVLKGEMSLVGPRPCLPSQSLLVAERERRGVYHCRPGITGLAQVRGIDMSAPERLAEEDGIYARSRTLLLDVRILLATVFGPRAVGL